MKYIAFLLLVIVILPYRLADITQPLANITNFRQAQTATVALNYYKNGIDLLKTELDIFGKDKERYLTLEFPIYEAIVASLYKIFFVSDMWGRIVSVIAGFVGGWFLFQIIFMLTYSLSLSLLSAFFFFVAPINMFHQRDFLIESTIVAFLLAGFYYSIFWIKNKGIINFLLGVSLLSIGFVQKGMYGPFWLIPIILYWKTERNSSSRELTRFIILILIPLFSLLLWQQYVNVINTANGHAYFTTTNKDHLIWNLGTFTDRFSGQMWNFRLRNLLNGIFLKPGIVIFLLGLVTVKKIRNWQFFAVWLGSEIIYFLTFFRIQSHIYYQMVMVPPIAVLMANGILQLRMITKRGSRIRTFNVIVISILCSIFLWRSWISSQWDQSADRAWYARVKQVGKIVPSNSWGIFVQDGYDWNSVYTYYPRLKMKLVGVEEVTPTSIENWKNTGYSYIVLHEYEKYPDYLKDVKPGHTLEFIEEYKEILKLEDFRVFSLIK